MKGTSLYAVQAEAEAAGVDCGLIQNQCRRGIGSAGERCDNGSVIGRLNPAVG